MVLSQSFGVICYAAITETFNFPIYSNMPYLTRIKKKKANNSIPSRNKSSFFGGNQKNLNPKGFNSMKVNRAFKSN